MVAIFMTNSPEMVFTYVALSKLGAVPAMINNALRSQTLAHCMNVANAKLITCTPDLVQHVLDLFSSTDISATCLSFNLSSFPPPKLQANNPNIERIKQVRYEDLAEITVFEPQIAAERSIFDPGCLIYTSGTSGKPKAVVMQNFALCVTSISASEDLENVKKYFPLRIFSCLPLFHATCLLIGFHNAVGTSSTICLVRKFSASKFSEQLTESRATRMLYVGEMCRYLLKAPPSKFDKAHHCIVATGNGLQADVWNKFRERYNIPEIREFYRSTEGIAGFENTTSNAGDAGYVGRAGPIRRRYEEITYLVKYDPETEAPWRDPKTGFCVPVGNNEPGEAIGRVMSMKLYREYLNNPEANEKKLIKDVFAKGDLFQRTGDLLMRDSNGWVKFVDRSGDTYRWRGENVSAGEVREHVSRVPNVHDVSVFGVKLPGYDGQAGAAGITLANGSTEAEAQFMATLHQTLRNSGLTVYQVPRLVRLTEQIDTNATFKHVKDILKTRPWDPTSPSAGKDRLYWLDGETYKKLDSDAWASINAGKARL